MGNLANKSINEIGQHILLYGPPKSGKTLLAGMVAKAFRTFWFDLEFQIPGKIT
jgi:Holliday junction resolvasome RuvABC ATP-dependent DNA helicase subunit